MQAAVADLTGCFDEELIRRAVTERTAKSKIAMKSGNITLEGFKDNEDDSIFELAAAHAETPKGVTAEHLSKVWRISDEVAQRTLEVTTQLNKQDVNASLSRRYGTNDRMLRYKRISSLFYTDTFFSKKVISKRGFSMMQLFVSDKGFVKVYDVESEKELIIPSSYFARKFGLQKHLRLMVIEQRRVTKFVTFRTKLELLFVYWKVKLWLRNTSVH